MSLQPAFFSPTSNIFLIPSQQNFQNLSPVIPNLPVQNLSLPITPKSLPPKCPICGIASTDFARPTRGFSRHLERCRITNLKRSNSLISGASPPIQSLSNCPVCDVPKSTFSNNFTFKRHVTKCGQSKSATKRPAVATKLFSPAEKKSEIFQCAKWKRNFLQKRYLSVHLKKKRCSAKKAAWRQNVVLSISSRMAKKR